MKELADERTAWHRAVWQAGTVVLLEEVVEATEATWSGIIPSDEAMRDVISNASQQLLRDPGVGSTDRRAQINAILTSLTPQGAARSKPTVDSQRSLDRLRSHITGARRGYMERWKAHVDDSSLSTAAVELAARLLVSHLIDEGLNRSHIHGWLTNTPDSHDLSQVIEEGRQMLLEPERRFDFIVGVRRAPNEVASALRARWLPSDAYLDAFDAVPRTARSNVDRPRAGAGAVRWSTKALDPHTAMAELGIWQQKVLARTRIGLGEADKLEFDSFVIDESGNRVRKPRSDKRRLRVPSLQRHGLFDAAAGFSEQVDDAIGLLASHSTSPYGPTIASVWAAAEGLLGRPGAKGTDVADSLADIVACSFPRAELHDLAKRWSRAGHGDLAERLRSEPSSTRRAELMAAQLGEHSDPGFTEPADAAAAARYMEIARDPANVLGRVRSYYRTAFRRLYYQRNFIMHAARFDSVTLPVASRTSPGLIAAAVDRIVNFLSSSPTSTPLDLAARARNEFELAGRPGGRPVHSLLE